MKGVFVASFDGTAGRRRPLARARPRGAADGRRRGPRRTGRGLADLRRQPPREPRLRPVRPERRAYRAAAGGDGHRARQSCRAQGLARRRRARPPRVREALRPRADRRQRPDARRRRRRDPGGDGPGPAVPGRRHRRRARPAAFRADRHAQARRGARPQRRAGRLHQGAAQPTSSSSPRGRPAPARPGSRSATRSRCWSRAMPSG